MDTKKLFTGWANLVDLGFEFSLANFRAKYTDKDALKEIRASLSRQNEEHCQNLIKLLKRLK